MKIRDAEGQGMARHEPFPFTPCSEEDVRVHLEAFIDAFITPSKRVHWRTLLFESKKAHRLFHEMRMGFPLDERFCRLLSNKEVFNQPIENLVGKSLGMYFSPDKSEPMKVLPSDALRKAWEDVADGFLSVNPGRIALVFNHEQDVWLCQR